MQRLLVLLVLPCVAAAFTAPSPLARPAVPQRVPVLQAAASVAEAPPPTNEAQAGAMLNEVDLDHDGQISFEEFVQVMTMSGGVPEEQLQAA